MLIHSAQSSQFTSMAQAAFLIAYDLEHDEPT